MGTLKGYWYFGILFFTRTEFSSHSWLLCVNQRMVLAAVVCSVYSINS